MEFENTSSGQPTCLSDTAQPSAVAAPVTPAVPPISPLTEIRWGRRWAQVHDVDGSLWDVREARGTKHGFDLLFGHIANSHLGGHFSRGPSQLIATPALIAYWEAHRAEPNALFDLPCGRWGLKRLRRQHGFNFFDDRRALWRTRTDDLKNLGMHDFAARHNVDFRVAQEWRMRLVGRVGRPAYWWKDPEIVDVFRSPLTHREVGETLGLSTYQARHLRRRVLDPDAKVESDRDRLLPARWRNTRSVAVLRSGLHIREVAKELGVSLTYAQRLRRFLANELQLAA